MVKEEGEPYMYAHTLHTSMYTILNRHSECQYEQNRQKKQRYLFDATWGLNGGERPFISENNTYNIV